MLKLKLQYSLSFKFSDSFEKTLMLGKMVGELAELKVGGEGENRG